MLNCGIYKIENLINGDFYIGQSFNLNKRKRSHYSYLSRNSHGNRHLQNAFNKYGKENFIFSILLYCEENELTYYEQRFVNILQPSYNICRECVNSSIGIKRTEATKAKLSVAHLGNIPSNKGIPRTEESKKKMSKSKMGKYSGKKCYWFGKTHSEETKQKISDSKVEKKYIAKELALEILYMLNNKYNISEISRIVGVSRDTIRKIRDCQGKEYIDA